MGLLSWTFLISLYEGFLLKINSVGTAPLGSENWEYRCHSPDIFALKYIV